MGWARETFVYFQVGTSSHPPPDPAGPLGTPPGWSLLETPLRAAGPGSSPRGQAWAEEAPLLLKPWGRGGMWRLARLVQLPRGCLARITSSQFQALEAPCLPWSMRGK